MWRGGTVTSRCVQMNAICLACGGEIRSSWIWPFRLACDLLRSSSILSPIWWSGFSSSITLSPISCTISTIFYLSVLRVRQNVLTASSSPDLFFSRLGLPLHPSKCEGPTTVLIFLGVELNSVAQMACLPHEKLVATFQLFRDWACKKWCTRKELESLIGSLHHVTKVVPPGRTFLRRMIDLLCAFHSRTHPIRLNWEFRRDLAWWLEFLHSWNGVSFFRMPSVCSFPDLFVASDSSGAVGFGAIWRNTWFSGIWPAAVPSNITALELFPIVVVAHIWGCQWQRLQVEFLSDNDAVVAVINSGTSRDPLSMHLLRHLVPVACQFHFSISARHVPGHHNAAADFLSRSRLQDFRRCHPAVDPDPAIVPPALVSELLNGN